MSRTLRTRVAIVGAGPAGLLLSQLLANDGIESVIVDQRTRADIEGTVKAGTLEYGTVQLLIQSGSTPNAASVAEPHEGIEVWFDGEPHRLDFRALTGRHAYLYPQHLVLIDQIATRLAAGQDLRFETTAVAVVEGDQPVLRVEDADGAYDIVADFLVGADGARSIVRPVVTGSSHGGYFREYPYAWFGILAATSRVSKELMYSASPDGFALISQRTDTLQRMYFQCDPETDPDAFTEAELWAELQKRIPGKTLQQGPITRRDVLRFRSFVASTLRRGRVAIVGDAAHTVPPTGAKGINMAVADVVLLAGSLRELLLHGDERPIDAFSDKAMTRIWSSQHFSWWMTSMTHRAPGADEFDRHRQLGELRTLFSSEGGRRYLAEYYVGWPFETVDGIWSAPLPAAAA